MRVSVPCDTPLPLLYRATVSGLTPANTASSICLSRSTLQNLRNPALRFLSVFTCDLPSMAITEDGAELALCGSGGEAGLHLARHVGDDAEETLDEHELAAVVHFVFFHGKNHLEAALGGRGHARGHLQRFGEENVGEPLQPSSPFLAGAAQHLDSLVLGAAFFFLRRQALHDRGEIESYKRRSAFGGVNLVLEVVRQGDMGQQLAGATGIRGGSKGVFLFGKILRNDESIFTDGAETVGQFFSGVAVHGTSLLSRVTSCHWREQGLRLHFSTPRRLRVEDPTRISQGLGHSARGGGLLGNASF